MFVAIRVQQAGASSSLSALRLLYRLVRHAGWRGGDGEARACLLFHPLSDPAALLLCWPAGPPGAPPPASPPCLCSEGQLVAAELGELPAKDAFCLACLPAMHQQHVLSLIPTSAPISNALAQLAAGVCV